MHGKSSASSAGCGIADWLSDADHLEWLARRLRPFFLAEGFVLRGDESPPPRKGGRPANPAREDRERFAALWKRIAETNEEHYVNFAHKLNRDESRRQYFLDCAKKVYTGAERELLDEMTAAAVREEGYERGRRDGIMEVFDRDRKNLEEGQKFTETPQGKKKREKAELIERTCECYRTGKYSSWENAARAAAKQLGMQINARSRGEQARQAYCEGIAARKAKKRGESKP